MVSPDDSDALEEPAGSPVIADRMVGEFRLLRKLGSGGMADVYLAEQTTLKRQVALKVLRPELVGDATYLERFAREATAAAGLNHPNIVQVYMVGEQGGVHFIAQEYVQGMNLREFLTRKGPPDLPVALHVMKQVASALSAAHEAGIVHRDIKPENILLTRTGSVKVTDFGLAQLTRDRSGQNLTQEGVTMGTPLYMSPEQVNGTSLDHRSDLYSFGVTCYHLLAGEPPFRGETAISVAMQHLNRQPKPLAETRSDLSRRLCDIVHRMMAKQPEERYEHAHLLLDDLTSLEQGLQFRSTGAAGEWVDFEPTMSLTGRLVGWFARFNWQGHRRLITVAAACLLTAALAAVVGWIARPPDPLVAAASTDSAVPRQEDVVKQFYFAAMVNSEAAWKAVEEYFPDKKLQVRRARQQLALYYLGERRLKEAEVIFGQFAAVGEIETEAKATGLAGLAIIRSLEKNYKESQEIISNRLNPGLRERLDPDMERLVKETITRNQLETGSEPPGNPELQPLEAVEASEPKTTD